MDRKPEKRIEVPVFGIKVISLCPEGRKRRFLCGRIQLRICIIIAYLLLTWSLNALSYLHTEVRRLRELKLMPVASWQYGTPA